MPDGLECPELFLKKQSETNQNADSPDTEKQDAENLHLEIQSIENQGQLNTYTWISALRFSTTTSFPAENDTSQIITPF